MIAEVNAQRASARTLAKLERKRQQAEAMGEKARAAETGEDLERKKNWEYSIEDNERWDKKLARKERRADYSFTGQFSLLLLLDRPVRDRRTDLVDRTFRLRRRDPAKIQEGPSLRSRVTPPKAIGGSLQLRPTGPRRLQAGSCDVQ